LQSFIVIKGVLLIVFFMLQMTGDPAGILMPEDADKEDIAQFKKEMGFDLPMHIQYFNFLFGYNESKGVLRGDFGFSFHQELPALGLVLGHFPATALLAFTSVILASLISIPAGVLSAVYRNTWIDYFATVGAMLGQSVPGFWLGLLFIMFFAVKLEWLPTSGADGIEYLVLPAMTAGLYATARLTRLVRSGMLEVLGSDYIQTARSKGLVENVIVFRHALKNASIPVVTLIGLELGILLGGTVVVEVVFSWPGVGFLVVDSIRNQDYPVVQAAVALLATCFVVVNLSVDLLYAWLDPRIAYK
jgi:ABC-type dipeptide/oligopeptide/nickel transport system permease component